MRIIIIDSTQSPERVASAVQNAATQFKASAKVIQSVSDYNPAVDATPDLLLLHSPDIGLRGMLSGLCPVRELRYSGSGTPDGIPRGISGADPLRSDEARALLTAASLAPGDWSREWPRVWAGIPENLLAWALCKSVGVDLRKNLEERQVRTEFDELQKALLSGSLTNDTELKGLSWSGDAQANLKAAKTIIKKARVDV